MQNIKLCSGHGQYHSDSPKDPKATAKPYGAFSLAELPAMMESPPQVEKSQAQWVIFSNLISGGRSADRQRKQGHFYALWGDLDDNQGKAIGDVIGAVMATVGSETKAFIYNSKSATNDNPKARIIVPLSEPVSGVQFEQLQQVFNDKLKQAGIEPDRKTETANQVCYLPNRGEYYEQAQLGEKPFNAVAVWGDDLAKLVAEAEQHQARLKQQRAESLRKAQERQASGQFVPIDSFNQAHDVCMMLEFYGYRKQGSRYLSPLSESGNAGVSVKGDKWISSHGSDLLSGIGATSGDCKTCYGDAFDLYAFYEHNNDRTAATKAVADMLDPDGQQNRQRKYMAEKSQQEAAAMLNSLSPVQHDSVKAMFNDTERPPTRAANDSVGNIPYTEGVDLLKPPSLAGNICRFMELTCKRPRPELYPFTAMQVMALAGRESRSEYAEVLRLFTLAVAVSASGKEHAISTFTKFALDLYSADLVHGEIASFKDVMLNMLDGGGFSYYTIDEVHSLFKSMQNDSGNSNSYETKIEAEILKVSTSQHYLFRGLDKRNLIDALWKSIGKLEAQIEALKNQLEAVDAESKDAIQKQIDIKQRCLARDELKLEHLENGIPNPCVGILGFSTPSNFDSFVKVANADSGLLGRAIIKRCPETREPLRPPLTYAEAGERDSLELDIINALVRIKTNKVVLTPTSEARAFIEKCFAWYDADEQRNHPVTGAIYARAPEQLTKVASVLALGCDAIGLSHAKYAHAFVADSILDMQYLMQQSLLNGSGDYINEQQIFEQAKRTVIKTCRGQGETPSRIKQLVSKPSWWVKAQTQMMPRDLFDELINQMLDKGELEEIKEGRKHRYKTP